MHAHREAVGDGGRCWEMERDSGRCWEMERDGERWERWRGDHLRREGHRLLAREASARLQLAWEIHREMHRR